MRNVEICDKSTEQTFGLLCTFFVRSVIMREEWQFYLFVGKNRHEDRERSYGFMLERVRRMIREIKHISDFLEEIEEISGENTGRTIVFRGETQIFEKPCYPNLFRKKILEENLYFEKNQFDEMTANHLTDGTSYLEKAIDAQHGGFPSRLLDVTYNCLVALYFAVTPFYYEPEEKTDGRDGMVYVFPVEKMYCPTGNNIRRAYDMIVNRNCSWMNNQPLFQKNHKLIDHIKLNSRIIAQQGAFILFQGDEGEEIPPYQYRTIRIKGENKRKLRQELKNLCGIHTGSIYPEKYNLVNEIVEKSNRLSSREFTFENELELVMTNLDKCLEHYIDEIAEHEEYRALMGLVMESEKKIQSFKDGIEKLESVPVKEVTDYEKVLEHAKKQYTEKVREFFTEVQGMIPEEIELSADRLVF